MNWLSRMLGRRDREYRGDDFSVRIDPGFREIVHIIRSRQGASRNLDGELIGKRWEGISVEIPQEIEQAEVPQIVGDLERAFGSLGYGYVIFRAVGVDAVPEAEQQASLAELNEMGFEVEVSADRQQASLRRRPGVGPPDGKSARSMAPRVMTLMQSLRGTRQRFEVLAHSKEFPEGSDYMPR